MARADRRVEDENFPFTSQDTEDAIQPQYAIELLYEMTKGEAIITTGVGQHQMWAGAVLRLRQAAHAYHQRGPRLDGLRLPGALGAKVAFPDKEVIDIDGDGSFVMNIQELAMARVEGHRRQGDHPEQSAPRHGGAVGGSLLQVEPRPHLPRSLQR